MGLDVHTVEMTSGSKFTRTDRVLMNLMPGVANVAGGSAGAAVTTAVLADLPANYGVFIGGMSQLASVTVTSKTNAGFNVVLTPASGVTLAIGTFDVLIVA